MINEDRQKATRYAAQFILKDNNKEMISGVGRDAKLYQQHEYAQFAHGLSITDKEFYQLATYIKENYGIHINKEKKVLLTTRLHNVLMQNGFKNFTEYYENILSDKTGEVVSTLINQITTNHTFFMREAEHFIYFKENVLPFFKNTVTDRDLRVWSAGCSTGEELYTLAMIMDEFFGEEKKLWDTKILATDISAKVLDSGTKGIYENEKIAALPSKWKTEYFTKLDGEKNVVVDKVKNEVIYRKFNLMERVYPFKRKFHVIFCRNVMIYFDEKTRNELINKFYDLTEYGGYLFIGHSETINRGQTRYKYIKPAVYRKE